MSTIEHNSIVSRTPILTNFNTRTIIIKSINKFRQLKRNFSHQAPAPLAHSHVYTKYNYISISPDNTNALLDLKYM